MASQVIDDQNSDLDSSIYPISTSNSSFSSVHIDGESDELSSDFDNGDRGGIQPYRFEPEAHKVP